MRILELYAGIGGLAASVRDDAEIVAAIDQSNLALTMYRANFNHPTFAWNLSSVEPARLEALNADLWWMSPPCTPFTLRGARQDIEDPRSESFVAMVEHIKAVRPRHVAMENVPGFVGSRAHALLTSELASAGYHSREHLLCPTELGVPNKRRRYYLAASLDRLVPRDIQKRVAKTTLQSYIDPDWSESLRLDPDIMAKYESAITVVDANDDGAIATCFTSAYGRSPVKSGSYLRLKEGVRHFSPREILALLHFPEHYIIPPGIDRSQGWRLVGNSLSVSAVREILGHFRQPSC